MIAIRQCHHCKKTFEADVGNNTSPYCPECQDIISLLSDIKTDEDEMAPHPVIEQDSLFDIKLLEQVSQNLRSYNASHPPLPRPKVKKSTSAEIVDAGTDDFDLDELDDETTAFLQGLEIPDDL